MHNFDTLYTLLLCTIIFSIHSQLNLSFFRIKSSQQNHSLFCFFYVFLFLANFFRENFTYTSWDLVYWHLNSVPFKNRQVDPLRFGVSAIRPPAISDVSIFRQLTTLTEGNVINTLKKFSLTRSFFFSLLFFFISFF